MQTWIIYALISMIFAGLTAVLVKYGLQNISADFGLGIRTTEIWFNHYNHHLIRAKYKEFANLTTLQITLRVASGITTTLSWTIELERMDWSLMWPLSTKQVF